MSRWRELVRRVPSRISGLARMAQGEAFEGVVATGSKPAPWLIRAALALALIATAVYFADVRQMAQLLERTNPFWSVLGVALVAPQLALLALRWQLTAAIVGAKIDYRYALREYALSLFVNQLPAFGVAGDLLRISRHGQRMKREAPANAPLRSGVGSLALALRAVLLERLSGQLVVLLWALCVLPAWAHVLHAPPLATIAVVSVGLALFVIAARGAFGARVESLLSVLIRDLCGLLAPRRTLFAHLALSLAVTATIVLQFVCAAHALRATFPIAAMLRIVPFALLSMVLPFTAGGWGTREAAMAVLYRLSGLAVAEGVAVSLAFGVISTLASLLGFLVFYRGEDRFDR